MKLLILPATLALSVAEPGGGPARTRCFQSFQIGIPT